MNGYLRAALAIPNGYLKLGIIKLFHFYGVSFGSLPRISANTEISVEHGGKLQIGKRFNMRGSARIRTNKGASLEIGDNTSLANGCMIVCHKNIKIGNNVQLSPNVLIYDHDHDFRCAEGLIANKYIESPVIIGNNVWIGANTVILRGSIIGDNCVVGAGCVIKGEYSENSLIIQTRNEIVKEYGLK